MRLRNLQENTNAISEEFTVLPSLAVVLFGILLTFILFGTTYESYQDQSEFCDTMTTTELIYQKIITPSNPFIMISGIIDYSSLFTNESIHFLKTYQDSLGKNGLNFSLYFSSNNLSFWYPKAPPNTTQRTAVTHPIGLAINAVETIQAKVSIIIWNISDEID